MRWPWKSNPKNAREVREARQRLDRVMADWQPVLDAAGELRMHTARNHIMEKAFALREKGER